MTSQNRHFRTANEAYLASLMPRRRAHAVALVLVLILLGELAFSVHRQSLSWDEGDHIYLKLRELGNRGDFGINPEHPPLLKEIATLPLLAMHLNAPPRTSPTFSKAEAYFNGRSLIYDNGGLETASKIIFRARMMAAIFSLALATFGQFRRVLRSSAPLRASSALHLVVFEPNLIAHGAYVTTDMAVAFRDFRHNLRTVPFSRAALHRQARGGGRSNRRGPGA